MSWFKKGYEDASKGKTPSIPRSGYDGGNVLLDVMCPGLGLAMAAGEPSVSNKDKDDYQKGYLSGSLQKK